MHDNTTHGATIGYKWTPEYVSYAKAKGRSTPGTKRYSNLEMDSIWSNSFQAFLKDMGEKPKGYVLSRHDFNIGYTPNNCFWELTREHKSRLAKWQHENGLLG